MKMARVPLLLVLTALLGAASPAAWADPGYRLVPLDDGTAGTTVFDLNRRGDVVGMRTVAGQTHAFRWRAGTFTDLHDTIDPSVSYTQAAGINDFSVIVGDKWTGVNFAGFLLRGSQVSPIAGGIEFPFDINNRGQIIGDSGSTSYLVDGDNVTKLDGLPGETDSMHSVALNNRGVITGYTDTSAGVRAVIWRAGVVTDLRTTANASSTFADDINDRNQVVGFITANGSSHAMRWQNGSMALLPKLAGEAASGGQSINDWGVIVGSTTLTQPTFHQTATLWWGNRVVELDRLVRASDPRKPFVHLLFAGQINDRGDIIVTGTDSRTNRRIVYFMTLFGN